MLSLDEQRVELAEVQKRHATELVRTGIAPRALQRRFDKDWYSDADIAHRYVPAESMPMVMMNSSNLENSYLYVVLRSRTSPTTVRSEEVNIATIHHSGTEQEKLIPEHGFRFDEAQIVHSLAEELLRRRSEDLPNLSDNLISITGQTNG